MRPENSTPSLSTSPTSNGGAIIATEIVHSGYPGTMVVTNQHRPESEAYDQIRSAEVKQSLTAWPGGRRMRPFRVLHVNKIFRPQFAGEGIFIERLCPACVRLRPDVVHEVLVTATPRPDASSPAQTGIAATHYLTANARTPASQIAQIFWAARNFHRFDVVHYHTHTDRTFLSSALFKLTRTRIVLSATLDDSIPGLLKTYRRPIRAIVRKLLGLVDCFVAISPKLHDENTRFVPARKCVLIPMGIPIRSADNERRRKCRRDLGISDSACVLVSVGGLCRRKDQMFLLNQHLLLREHAKKVVLVLVGPTVEPDYHAEMLDFIEKNALAEHVRLVGFTDEPWTYYAASDLMVFASREEGFGTVVIEAMASGLPVVTRHLPGVNDSFIQQGQTGYLFDQASAYQEHVLELIANPDLRHRLGFAAREFVVSHFNIEDTAAKYLKAYGLTSTRKAATRTPSAQDHAACCP